MSGRYRILVFAVLASAVAVSALARLPRRSSETRPVPVIVRATDLALTIDDAGITPAAAVVPKGWRVRLTVANAGRAPRQLRLAGYEDRVAIVALAPGAAWRDSFLADRPGEDFAWLLDGRPAGRLAVAGSHLEEGHR